MIQSNRITIIVDDSIVHLDQGVLINLKLDSCAIPSDVHALQFLSGAGEIEFRGDEHNQPITELPQWAVNCINVYENALQFITPVHPSI